MRDFCLPLTFTRLHIASYLLNTHIMCTICDWDTIGLFFCRGKAEREREEARRRERERASARGADEKEGRPNHANGYTNLTQQDVARRGHKDIHELRDAKKRRDARGMRRDNLLAGGKMTTDQKEK